MRKTHLGIWLASLTAMAITVVAAESQTTLQTSCMTLLAKVSSQALELLKTAPIIAADEDPHTLKALAKVDKQLAEFTPGSKASTAKKQSGSLTRRATEAQAAGNLGELRVALSIYFGDHERFPEDLNKLVPKYIKQIPTLELPDHPPTTQVKIMRDVVGNKVSLTMLGDTGQWLYFYSDKPYSLYGYLVMDCIHTGDMMRKPLYEY